MQIKQIVKNVIFLKRHAYLGDLWIRQIIALGLKIKGETNEIVVYFKG